jgi:hypothetical protein
MQRSHRIAYVAGAAVLLVGLTRSGAQGPREADRTPPIRLGQPLRIDPGDDALRKLQKERYNEALAEAKARHGLLTSGKATVDEVFNTFQRFVYAGLEVADTPAARVSLLKQYADLAKEVERIVAEKVKVGKVDVADLHRARYIRLDAEIQLLRARAKAKDGQAK